MTQGDAGLYTVCDMSMGVPVTIPHEDTYHKTSNQVHNTSPHRSR